MLKIGDTGIGSIYLGNQKIVGAYLGSTVVFDQGPPPVPSFVITASVDPEGGGTVSGAGTYQLGESVTVTAVSGDGYEFSGWTENGVVVSTDSSYTFTVSGDRDLVAVFEELAESPLPDGSVELEYIYQTGTTYKNGAYIELPAITAATRMKLKYSHISSTVTYGSAQSMLCGSLSYSSSTLSAVTGIKITRITANKCDTYIFNNSKSYSAQESNQGIFPDVHTLVLDYTNKKIIIDDAETAKTPGTWFRNALRFFGCKMTSGSTSYAYPAPYTAVHRVTWEDDQGNVLRDLVPCKKADGTICMYDIVGNVYYTDENTNTTAVGFTAGPEA